MVIAEIFSPDILIIAVVVAVIFGGKKLPELARSLGSAKREFEDAQRGSHDAAAAPTDTGSSSTRTASSPAASSQATPAPAAPSGEHGAPASGEPASGEPAAGPPLPMPPADFT
jgi:sec-independent protein translocase protein TatA